MDLMVGTSGFSYAAWKGRFYPKRIAATEMLPFYAGVFGTVEINNTFHRMPKPDLLDGWAGQVPATFRFALKAPERITHRARLADESADATRYFTGTAARLGERLGPLLFQLPPYFRKDIARLTEFLGRLPPGLRAAFEFRHPSWLDDEVYSALAAANAAWCVAEDDDRRDPPVVATADWGYLRLRRPDYDESALAEWAARVAAAPWTTAFVYFKHEDEAKGPEFARTFEALAARSGLGVRSAS